MADLTKDKLRRLTTVPDDFLSKIPKAEQQVYDKVVELIGRLQISNGSYVISSKNLKIAADITQLLRGVLLASDYTRYVTEFAKEFDQQAIVNNKLFEAAFPVFEPTELGKSVVNLAKRNAIDLLLNRASDTDFIAPLRETIEQAVVNGAGYRETLQSIRTFIEGSDGELGALSKYSKTYAHNVFSVSDGAYTSIVAEELDADWFIYAGDEIATTRPFCLERHGQYYHWKEIEGWFAIPEKLQPGMSSSTIYIKDGAPYWNGIIEGTNKDTIYSYKGGNNCRHSILPVSLFSVPMDVIQRNIESGNYEPSEKELELLGM